MEPGLYRDVDASHLWLAALDDLVRKGERVSPRGMATRERRPAVLQLEDPRQRWVEWTERKLAPKLGIVEGLSLLAGTSRPDMLKAVAPQYKRFIDPATGELDGAYGPRVGRQMPYILRLLEQDPDTRQAVVNIHSELDHRVSLDVPCTVSLQFLVRDPTPPSSARALELVVYMRSNDVWLGVPYDVVQFTMLQEAAAAHLGLELGTYTHIDGSLHLYERDLPKAESIIKRGRATLERGLVENPPMAQQGFGQTQSEALDVLIRWWNSRGREQPRGYYGSDFFVWAYEELVK